LAFKTPEAETFPEKEIHAMLGKNSQIIAGNRDVRK
jgi:hypothetical protein